MAAPKMPKSPYGLLVVGGPPLPKGPGGPPPALLPLRLLLAPPLLLPRCADAISAARAEAADSRALAIELFFREAGCVVWCRVSQGAAAGFACNNMRTRMHMYNYSLVPQRHQ
jgi:hypothetical protein